jgi:hypothetical protein
LLIPDKANPTVNYVSSMYHAGRNQCKTTPPAPIASLPPFALPPTSTYVAEEKVAGVKCQVC